MSTIETVLVIMLGIGFFVLLVLAIIVLSLLIAIMRRMKRISERAEEATANISDAASLVSSKLAPVAISTLVGIITKKMRNRGKDS
jgi:hypothetical protein